AFGQLTLACATSSGGRRTATCPMDTRDAARARDLPRKRLREVMMTKLTILALLTLCACGNGHWHGHSNRRGWQNQQQHESRQNQQGRHDRDEARKDLNSQNEHDD